MHLNLVDNVHAVFAVNHIDGKSSSAEATRAANPVKVRLIVSVPVHVHRKVKVHHKWHLFHINTCNQKNHRRI